MIYRATATENFCKVRNDFAQNAELSFGARGLLIFLLSLPEATNDGEVWQIWRTQIDEFSGTTPHVVSKYLKELQQLGYCILVRTRTSGKVKDKYLFSELPREGWAKSFTKIHTAKSVAAKKGFETQQQKGQCNLRNLKATAATDNAPTAEATPQQPQQAQPKERKPQPKAAASQAAAPQTPDNSTELAEKLYNFAVRRRFNSSIPFEQSPTHREKLKEILKIIANELRAELGREATPEEVALCLSVCLQTVCFSLDIQIKFNDIDKLKPAYILHSIATVWTVHQQKRKTVRQRFESGILQIPTEQKQVLRPAYSSIYE